MRAVCLQPALHRLTCLIRIGKWRPQGLMYHLQDILNGDSDISTLKVAESLDIDNLRIPWAALQSKRKHGWVHSGG